MIPGIEIADEEKILLLLSDPFFKKKNRKKIASIVRNNSGLNLKKIYSLALNNEVSGFVFKNSDSIHLFSKKDSITLKKIYLKTTYSNLHLLRETLSVIKLLDNNQVPVIPLKGAVVSDLLFNDFGVYPFGDIDILVHPSKLGVSKKILCNQGGFSQIQIISEADLLTDHYHLIFRNKAAFLEVHWNLVKRYFSIPADFWWQESKEFKWNGINTHELAIEKYILYNIFRLFDHCYYPLRFYVLLKGLIEINSDNINWEELLGFSYQYKMGKLVTFTLQFLKEIMDTNIPEDCFKKKYSGYYIFKSMVLSGIVSGVPKKHRKMLFYTLLLIDKKTIGRILIKRLFPSKGELRLRYSIPPESKLIFFYYVLNPFLLLVRDSKKSNKVN